MNLVLTSEALIVKFIYLKFLIANFIFRIFYEDKVSGVSLLFKTFQEVNFNNKDSLFLILLKIIFFEGTLYSLKH